MSLQLESIGDDFDGPAGQRRRLAGLEADVEIAWVLGIDAEGVHGTLWVCFGVCL